jgi:hypothetical protein
MQQYPICFDCGEDVEHSPVFEAPCGHDRCPSTVFHGVCLMAWRERRELAEQRLREWLERHTEFGPRG